MPRKRGRKTETPKIPGYEILGIIGEGGQGVVYRARQKSLDRLVAIKVLADRHADDPVRTRRFLKEARMASKLHHLNILQGIDVGQCGGRLFFVMEHVKGRDAYRTLQARGPLPENEVLDIGFQVAQALQYAWEQGIVHGDVKPDNLMIGDDGVTKVVDFGIARLTRRAKGDVEGTPGFLAPEIESGQSRGDIRSDLYSLGATLYELLAGVRPEEGASRAASGPDVRKQAPTVRAGTAAIISRLMAADPDRRFKTPKQLLEALKEVSEFAAEHEVRPLAHKKSLLQRVSAPWFIAQRGSCRRW